MKKLLTTYFQRQAFQLCCLSVFIVMITTLQIKANDGLVNQSKSNGGVTLRSGKNSPIRMDSEYVEIKLYKRYYTVHSTFWLYNTEKKTKAKVAFPQSCVYSGSEFLDEESRANRNIDGFLEVTSEDIVTTVNDSIVPFKTYYEENWSATTSDNVTLSSKRDVRNWLKNKGKHLTEEERRWDVNGESLVWLVKNVVFPAKTTTKTTVSLKDRYNYSEEVRDGIYIFGSGKSWKGNIQKSIFKIIKAEEDSSTLRIELPNKYDTNKVVQRTKLPNGELLEFYNYKPDESDEIQFFLIAKEAQE